MRSQETLMMQDIWRKAWEKADGLNITFKSKAGAIRARMALYNAVKSVKAGGDEFTDAALRSAANELEIVWVDDTTIRLQKRAESDMMQGFMAVLGKKPQEYMDPEVAESAAKLLAQLESLGVAPVVENSTSAAPQELPQLGEHQDNEFYGKRS